MGVTDDEEHTGTALTWLAAGTRSGLMPIQRERDHRIAVQTRGPAASWPLHQFRVAPGGLPRQSDIISFGDQLAIEAVGGIFAQQRPSIFAAKHCFRIGKPVGAQAAADLSDRARAVRLEPVH